MKAMSPACMIENQTLCFIKKLLAICKEFYYEVKQC